MPVTRNQWRSSRGPSRTESASNDSRDESESSAPVSAPSNDLKAKEKAVKTLVPNNNNNNDKQTKQQMPSSVSKQVITLAASNPAQQQRLPEKNFHILIGVTGSVATVKMIELITRLKSQFPRTFTCKTTNETMQEFKATISIRVVTTEHSKHFIKQSEFNELKSKLELQTYDDSDEWAQWKEIGDPVLHIELRKWADLYLIAPLDANTMAKLANGICDNLLTCVARAWDTSRPLVYCPAMNTHMYNHPITRDQLCKLQSFGYLRVDAVEKRLACGDVGMGGMASLESIVDKVVESLTKPQQSLTKTLTKPLLNSQPTYPIISINECLQVSPSKLPTGIELLNRLKANNQITLPALGQRQTTLAPVPTSTPSSSSNLINSGSRIGFIRHSPQIGQSNAAPTALNLMVNKNHQQSMTGSTFSVNAARNYLNNNKSSVIIPSLQNLKRIDSNFNSCGGEFDDLDVDLDDEQEPEGFDYDIDPSKLLEQTLITDETMGDDDSGSSQSFGINQMTSSSDDGLMMQNDFITPVFNTSKFLLLCQNKNKGCYTCAICKKNYKNRKSMARHLKEQHVQGNIFHCTPCGVAYKRKEKLIKHIRERHDGAVQH